MNLTLSFPGFRYAYTETEMPEPQDFTMHLHRQYEILYFLSGEAVFEMGMLCHKMDNHEIILVPPLYKHRMEIRQKECYRRVVLNFECLEGLDKKNVDKLFEMPRVIQCKERPHIQDLFSRFQQYNLAYPENTREKLFQLLLNELICLLEYYDSSSQISYFVPSEDVIHRATRYINEHLFEIKDISELCRELYTSKSYLHKVFLQYFGMGPMKFIKNKRLLEAREMLLIGEKATVVSEKVGYADYSTFFRAYRAYFGYSPRKKE